MLIFLLSTLIIILPVLINVAFITLLERKILRYRQLRKGPNKVGGGGFFNPLMMLLNYSLKRLGLRLVGIRLYFS